MPLKLVFILTGALALLAQDVSEKAKGLSAEQVQALEKRVAEQPDDDQSRGLLLAYYVMHTRRDDRLRHCLWLVENRPASPLFNTYYAKISAEESPLSTMSAFEKARAIWLRQIELRTTEARVLYNAAPFIAQFDPNLAERLVLQARELNPKDRQWEQQLAYLYGKGIFTDGRFRPQTPPSAERSAFAKRARAVLEVSSNPTVLGLVGLLMAPQDASVLRTRAPEIVELGEKLLRRAQALAPKDPQWQIYLRDFEAARAELASGVPRPPLPVSNAEPGTLIRRVEAAYPEIARRAGIKGEVQLQLLIGTEGRVLMVRPLDGPAELQLAAAAAAKQWIFKPIEINGQPVEGWKQVEIPFRP